MPILKAIPQVAKKAAQKSSLLKTLGIAVPVAAGGYVGYRALTDKEEPQAPMPAPEMPAPPPIMPVKEEKPPVFQFSYPAPTAPMDRTEDAIKLAKMSFIAGALGNKEGSRLLAQQSFQLSNMQQDEEREFKKQQQVYNIAKQQAGTLWSEGVRIGKYSPEFGNIIRQYAQTGQLSDAQQLINNWHIYKRNLDAQTEALLNAPPSEAEQKAMKLHSLVELRKQYPQMSLEEFRAHVQTKFPMVYSDAKIAEFYRATTRLANTLKEAAPMQQPAFTKEQLDRWEQALKENPNHEKADIARQILRQYGRIK